MDIEVTETSKQKSTCTIMNTNVKLERPEAAAPAPTTSSASATTTTTTSILTFTPPTTTIVPTLAPLVIASTPIIGSSATNTRLAAGKDMPVNSIILNQLFESYTTTTESLQTIYRIVDACCRRDSDTFATDTLNYLVNLNENKVAKNKQHVPIELLEIIMKYLDITKNKLSARFRKPCKVLNATGKNVLSVLYKFGRRDNIEYLLKLLDILTDIVSNRLMTSIKCNFEIDQDQSNFISLVAGSVIFLHDDKLLDAKLKAYNILCNISEYDQSDCLDYIDAKADRIVLDLTRLISENQLQFMDQLFVITRKYYFKLSPSLIEKLVIHTTRKLVESSYPNLNNFDQNNGLSGADINGNYLDCKVLDLLLSLSEKVAYLENSHLIFESISKPIVASIKSLYDNNRTEYFDKCQMIIWNIIIKQPSLSHTSDCIWKLFGSYCLAYRRSDAPTELIGQLAPIICVLVDKDVEGFLKSTPTDNIRLLVDICESELRDLVPNKGSSALTTCRLVEFILLRSRDMLNKEQFRCLLESVMIGLGTSVISLDLNLHLNLINCVSAAWVANAEETINIIGLHDQQNSATLHEFAPKIMDIIVDSSNYDGREDEDMDRHSLLMKAMRFELMMDISRRGLWSEASTRPTPSYVYKLYMMAKQVRGNFQLVLNGQYADYYTYFNIQHAHSIPSVMFQIDQHLLNIIDDNQTKRYDNTINEHM